MKSLAFIAAAAAFCGCATIDPVDGKLCAPVEDGLEVVEAVQIMNTNWRLLSIIPIASGNPDKPNKCSCRWFSNTVKLGNQLKMLEAEARRAGATKAVNVYTDCTSECAFLFLLQRQKLHTSAVLVRARPTPPEEGGAKQ